MSDLVISNLIKIILVAVVVIAVALMLYLVFKNNVIDFFKGFAVNTSAGTFFALLGGLA